MVRSGERENAFDIPTLFSFFCEFFYKENRNFRII